MTKKAAKDRSVASFINKELGGITPKNPAVLLGGPPGIALDMALTAARAVQEKKLSTKEEAQAKVRKRVIEESRVKKVAKTLAKRTKKHKDVAKKVKQYGTTKGSR
jgi:hypothetical protein